MRKLFYILILALTSTLAYAQRPDQIELACPAGSSPVFWGTSFNVSTGKYRQWLCSDNNGNIFINTSSIASTGAINISAGGTNQNITLTPSGTGNLVVGTPGPFTGATGGDIILGTGKAVRGIGSGGVAVAVMGVDSVGNVDLGAGAATANDLLGRLINVPNQEWLLRIDDVDAMDWSSTNVTSNILFKALNYGTETNCASAASPAACGSAAAGHFVIAASATSVVVDTTAVTANSEILINEDQTQGTNLSVTCNTGISSQPVISAATPGTSFTVTISTGLATNPVCYGYSIIN